MNSRNNTNKYYVYVHQRKDNGKIFYVGKGSGRRAYKKQGRNPHWWRIVNKHGYDVEFKAINLPEDISFKFEVFLIAYLKQRGVQLCNISEGGEGASGNHHTPESRKKLSDKAKGRTHSAEAIKNMSEARLGTTLPLETCVKISKSKTGATLTEETKRKLSQIVQERYNNPDYRAKGLQTQVGQKPYLKVYIFENISGDLFIGTRKEFCSIANLTSKYVSKLFLTKPRKTVSGWMLRGVYVEDILDKESNARLLLAPKSP